MNFLAFFFILSTFYYLVNKPHLQKNVDQKLIMYDNKKWILLDIVYYLHQIFYWLWLFVLVFTKWWIFAIILLTISVFSTIDKWLMNANYDSIISIVKIFTLFCLLLAPFFL
jgi:hypothetical protein